MSHLSNSTWQIWVDTGGTFTDCIAIDPDGYQTTVKVLSSSSLRGQITASISDFSYQLEEEWEAPRNFISGFTFSLLDEPEVNATVTAFDPKSSTITLDKVLDIQNFPASFEVQSNEEAPILAARLATMTSSNQSLPPLNFRLATTKATNALLEKEGAPTALFVTEGYQDLLEIGNQQRPDLFAMEVQKRKPIYDHVVEVPGRLGHDGNILKELNCSDIDARVEQLIEEGISTAGIALMNSFKNGKHEQKLKKWLLNKGFDHVSTSSELSPFIGIIPRAETTLVNAYLSPIIQDYLDDVENALSEHQLYVMTSAGGLTVKDQFTPKDSLLSGPAGGVVGAATAGEEAGFNQVISFDMGGTSTDVARYDSGFDYIFEHSVGDAHLVAPALNIETVAAGGGSVCYFDGHKLCVGPQSAGAFPGPACYGAGGPLTMTDVNLLLGRLHAQNFHIPVDISAAERELEKVVEDIHSRGSKDVAKSDILTGFLKIANERMADAICKVSVRKGYDTQDYAMVAFGGAGGQHACAIAHRLDIDTIIIPKEAGLLSAFGIGHAEVEEFAETQILKRFNEIAAKLDDICSKMTWQAKRKLQDIGILKDKITVRRKILSMRLQGQETSLEIEFAEDINPKKAFKKAYKERYGHWISDRIIEVESLRVVVAMQNNKNSNNPILETHASSEPAFEHAIWFDGVKQSTPVFDRGDLKYGSQIDGPALILDPHSTIVVEPDWRLIVNKQEALQLEKKKRNQSVSKNEESEVVNLELFTNRFSSIASEMGEMLQRTALSVNVKDRLDFSCALLNAKGELVVNAPHIPVHLGALGLCVRKLKEELVMEPGDVVVANHPAYGGSHLPDVTVVTPIYIGNEHLVGYAASRAHHAEIGGITPGSMPPTATNLQEEGVVIPPMYAIRGGSEEWKKIRKHLLSGKYPTRNVEENIADLQAAVAANQRGVTGLQKLCKKYGIEEVEYYMNKLQAHAETKMRDTITNIPSGNYESKELLDDGTPLKVTMEVLEDRIAMNFDGTGSVHKYNLNATPAIVNSVVMYMLRLLIDEPIPLNEGLLNPVDIRLPNCLLNPNFNADPGKCPAVVGGNTEVSQRLVDTLLKPFDRMACSQGTMNNVLFGNDNFGYYETVGGGTGAGPDFDGTDAVHHHMTNTKGTDPEILEYRYPVRLEEYSIRRGSGGKGLQRGGNGIVRKMTFLEDVELTVLTQHRKNKPYGLQGGSPGKEGQQWVVHKDGRRETLNSVDGRSLQKGDQFILKTPGGGGFGD
ncbi:hydantoinase B/oxoprolinase family protein [Fodinibius sp. SL11]|uniref:hydantoinase B/oxoprolinase family protein n=1 Tax=Fodinibius sp. SL11 TaxID=3425690 RepID=UPI003F881DD8